MLPKPPLHNWLTKLRADLRAGDAPPDTPSHLLQTARIWDTLERIAREPSPPEDILHVCGLVSKCAAGMLHAKRGVAAALERLAQAPAEDLGRMERALADFYGLDPQNYYRACRLALWTEAERVPQNGRIPTEIARKVAEAVEQNVPQGLTLGEELIWEPFVIARVPLPEGLRMLHVLSDQTADKKIVIELLWSLHPEGHPDAIWGPSPHQDSARLAIQDRNRESLRAWVNTASANGEAKEHGLSVLVPALVEAYRCDEALEYLQEIRSPSSHDAAALNAVRACAGTSTEDYAQAFLSQLTPGFNWVTGRVELMTARLRLSMNGEAAFTEMESIEEEIESEEMSERLGEDMFFPASAKRNFSPAIRRALAIGWTQIAYGWLDNGEIWKALSAAKRVLDIRYRSLCLVSILGTTLRRCCPDELIRIAETVLHAAEEFNSLEHTQTVLNAVIAFLARSGTHTGLHYALDLIEEKMIGAESLEREKQIQNALRMFVTSPPSELTREETAAVVNRILSASTRADCLYVLALHAAVEGEWEESERLERQAERTLLAMNRDPVKIQLDLGSAEWAEEPGLPEMLRWLRSRGHADASQSQTSQWFSEAIALAKSLRHQQQDALHAVGRLLIESPSFPGRGKLYRLAVNEIRQLSDHVSASAFCNDLRIREDAAFLESNDANLSEEWEYLGDDPAKKTHETSGENVFFGPGLLRKKFTDALTQIDKRREEESFISKFLEAAAPQVLNPIRKCVVEALFEAAERIRFPHYKSGFSVTVHTLALERGGTEDALWVAHAARSFARRSGVLKQYEEEVQKRLRPELSEELHLQQAELKERICDLEFADALREFEAEPEGAQKISNAKILFEKALSTGDSQSFFSAFNVVEDAFASETSGTWSIVTFEAAVDWVRQIGRLPNRADRIYLLRRVWDWYDWFKLQGDSEFADAFFPAWAGQMAAAGEVDLAQETVECLCDLDRRANGYADMAVGCGLTRGDTRALEFFTKFIEAARESSSTLEHQQAADMGVRRIAMVCAKEGDHQHFLKVIELGKEMLLSNKDGKAHFCLLMHLLEALSLANRTDIWAELLDGLAQSKQARGWNKGELNWITSSIWENYHHKPEGFVLSSRLRFIEKFYELMAGIQPPQQWDVIESRVLQICTFKPSPGDTPLILERFKTLSSCSPGVVGALLDDDFRMSHGENSPSPPDEPMLRWIANLCPYSDEAAMFFVAHIAGRLLKQNDWHSLRALARECPDLNLDWLEKIAVAVLFKE